MFSGRRQGKHSDQGSLHTCVWTLVPFTSVWNQMDFPPTKDRSELDWSANVLGVEDKQPQHESKIAGIMKKFENAAVWMWRFEELQRTSRFSSSLSFSVLVRAHLTNCAPKWGAIGTASFFSWQFDPTVFVFGKANQIKECSGILSVFWPKQDCNLQQFCKFRLNMWVFLENLYTLLAWLSQHSWA